MPPEIRETINQLNQELKEIEQESLRGLNLIAPALNLFPNNSILIQFSAYLNNMLFMVENYHNRILIIVGKIALSDNDLEIVQDSGEELGELLGRVLEAKIGLEGIINRLETLQ
jgi:hypothetical protein